MDADGARARPGHELQFAAMVEGGVRSPARRLPSTAPMRRLGPLRREPDDSLLSSGRAVVLPSAPPSPGRAGVPRPMVNLGRMTPDEAKAFLMREVALSDRSHSRRRTVMRSGCPARRSPTSTATHACGSCGSRPSSRSAAVRAAQISRLRDRAGPSAAQAARACGHARDRRHAMIFLERRLAPPHVAVRELVHSPPISTATLQQRRSPRGSIRRSSGTEWIAGFADLIDWLEAAEAVTGASGPPSTAGAASPRAAPRYGRGRSSSANLVPGLERNGEAATSRARISRTSKRSMRARYRSPGSPGPEKGIGGRWIRRPPRSTPRCNPWSNRR